MKHCRTGRVLLWGVIAILACSRYSMSAGDCNQRDRENDEGHEKRDEKRDEGRDEKKDGQDCNQNGIPDECDVKPTTKLVLEQETSVGGRPISLLAGDFDGDSFLDLLVVTTRPDGLSLLRGSPEGLKGAAELPAGDDPCFAAAGDLNGDLVLDLVLVHAHSNSLSILLGKGSATFAKALTLSLGEMDDEVCCVVIEDVDGDGNADLLVPEENEHRAIVFLNQGGGKFREAKRLDGREEQCTASGEVLLDFDGDGDLDLVAGDSDHHTVSVFRNHVVPPVSQDMDHNGIPDECPFFHRGDPDTDGNTKITDAMFLLKYLFRGGKVPSCKESADADNDGSIVITDAIVILNFLFRGGPPPAAPGPRKLAHGGKNQPCGPDPDPPGSAGDLGCESYDRCGSLD